MISATFALIHYTVALDRVVISELSVTQYSTITAIKGRPKTVVVTQGGPQSYLKAISAKIVTDVRRSDF
ncbi:hypothetical protein FB472_1667 [Rhodoglobus vestalii]|uniref:Uncharacterized protein n=1 Tax=Rhodoglobus vestalii TaxID=193384 RepID=A0A8H2K7E2_9MICO|nr:hypothetical protein FB472_1667 [Rhodoglobus vestalii]